MEVVLLNVEPPNTAQEVHKVPALISAKINKIIASVEIINYFAPPYQNIVWLQLLLLGIVNHFVKIRRIIIFVVVISLFVTIQIHMAESIKQKYWIMRSRLQRWNN